MRRKNVVILSALVVLGLICGVNRISFAQTPQRDRIAGPIAGSPAVWLEGNVRPMFQPENDLGPVEGSFKLENISLTFKLTESQQADLNQLLDEQQDRSSPNYHHWLTPEQYADRFGLSPNDINLVVAWLQSQGFQVTQTARGRTWVSFSGTAALVQAAFQTEIHNFSLRGRTYYANASEPAVPAAIADVVLGIRGLDNYRLKPRSIVRHVKAEPKPNFTSGLTGNTFFGPGDFATIYDVNALYNNSIDGTGQTIAVMGQTDLYNGGSDITDFREAAGLPANSPQVILIPNTSDPSVVPDDIKEASLDVEWSGAVAKNAEIIFVNGGSGGVFNALQYAIDNKTAPVISISYGACEAVWEQRGELQPLAQLAQQANTQGQTIVAAAGDSGAADCDASTSIVTVAMQGLAVDAPASCPYVTGMGGSKFNEGSGTYWQASAGGADVYPSALSYIPEMVWNDTSSTNGLAAGGGGVSAYFTPKPSWQTGTGVPNDGARDVPDLTLNSSPAHDPLLFCVEGSCVDGFRNTDGTLTVVGGTSAAAPTFAGIVALINQKHVNNPPGQGNINTILYPMAGTSPAAFHDITVGNNIVPCEVVSTDTGCPADGEMGYSAGVGYDQASGLGSVDAYNLVMEWGSTSTENLPAPTLTGPTNGATGVGVSPSFSWTAVPGNNGYRIMIATSAADLSTNPATITCSACTVGTTSANTTSYTPSSALAAAGTYYWQVQAIEPTSSTGIAAWSNIFSFTTAGGTLAAPALTNPANGATGVPLTTTFTWTTVSGSAGYRILIAPTASALPTNPAVGTCGNCVAGTTTATASYASVASDFSASTTYYWEVQALAASGSGQNGPWSSVFSFTTVPGSFSLSASPSSLTINPGYSGTSTVTLTLTNNFSGSITFSCNVSSTLAGVTCLLGTFNTSNNTVVATITAASSATTFPTPPKKHPFRGWPVAGLAACLQLMLLIILRRRDSQSLRWRPAVRQVALGAMLACLLALMMSCGGNGGGGGGGGTTTTSESGTVTVQGTSGSITPQTTTISVTVG